MNRKKLFNVLCAAALVLLTLISVSSCGAKDPGGDASDGNADATDDAAPTDTLWDKDVSYSVETVALRASDDDDYLATGLSPDGSKALVSGLFHTPYLLDLTSGAKTTLRPANEITRTAMQNRYMLSSMRALKTEEQREAFKEQNKDIDKLSDAELTDRFFSSPMGARLIPASYTTPATTPYMVITDSQRGLSGALNTETGEFTFIENGVCYGVCDGKILARRSSETGRLYLIDFATGEETEIIDFSFALENAACFINAAAMLPDGSYAAVVYSVAMTDSGCVSAAFAVLRKNGQKEIYGLGELYMPQVPAAVYSADGTYFLLRGSTLLTPLLFVKGEPKTVSVLGLSGNKPTENSLEDCKDESGMLRLPEDREFITVLAALNDSQTLLCADQDGTPLLFRPAAFKLRQLLHGAKGAIPVAATAYTGNGFDKWLILDRTMQNQMIALRVK